MYHEFDYYSLIKDVPLVDDRWHRIPDRESFGWKIAPQPEALFSASWEPIQKEIPTYMLNGDEIFEPVDEEEVMAYILESLKDTPALDDDDIFLFILRTMGDSDAFITGMQDYETAILERDEHVLCMIYSSADLLFETAEQYYDFGWGLGAEYIYRLLCLVGHRRARAKLGAMIRRGDIARPWAYSREEAVRLLEEGVKEKDPCAAVHLALLCAPGPGEDAGDWSNAEDVLKSLTPTGAYEVKEHWANWDLCGYVEGPLVHFLLMLFGKIEVPAGTVFSDLYRQVKLHFPSIVHLVNDRKGKRFWDPAGKEWKVLFTYEKWGNEYVLYTDHSRNENGSVRLRAGRTHPEQGWHGMCPLETDEEQKFIREWVDVLQKSELQQEQDI